MKTAPFPALNNGESSITTMAASTASTEVFTVLISAYAFLKRFGEFF